MHTHATRSSQLGIVFLTLFVWLAWRNVTVYEKNQLQSPVPGTHTERLLAGCGDVCHIDVRGTPSKIFDHITKTVDCTALMSNAEIDAPMVEKDPPSTIPADMLDAFTYNGSIPVKPYSQLFNDRYLSANALMSTWNKSMVDSWAALCMNRQLKGTYGVEHTNELLDAMMHVPLKNAHILVIGSEIPWVESCLLGLGA